jgi:phosphohistidine swiveling domain-containing protein
MSEEKYYKGWVFSFAPIIYFEAAFSCYVNNPFALKLGIDRFPKFIAIMDQNYEEWNTGIAQKITRRSDIEMIVAESRKILEVTRPQFEALNAKDFIVMNNEDLIGVLRRINEICAEVYLVYAFYIDEYFDTDEADLLKLLPQVRLELTAVIDIQNAICDKIIDAVFYRFEETIPWKTIIYATTEEIIGLLENPQAEQIEQFRKIANRPLAFVFDGKKLEVKKGFSEIEKLRKFLLKQTIELPRDLNELTGFVAVKGRAIGQVVKVSEYDYERAAEILKDKKDYILVTPMTRPEFVPYMKSARAIVTDEGGITCHAAIVSRELNLPCIVGTKFASEIFNNGDLVEVDADKGIVKIINRG